MSYDVHIVKTTDFVRVDTAGRFDVEESRKALADIARTCISRGVNAALLDVRHGHSNMTISDMYTLARTFHETGFRLEHRLAILHPFHGERAEFFAQCASQRGWCVRAFVDFEEAMEWFAKDEPVRPSVSQSAAPATGARGTE